MGGTGKTALMRSVYRSRQLGGWKRAWATALHPFSRDALLRNLCLQLLIDIQEDSTAGGDTQKKMNVGTMGFQDMIIELSQVLEKQKCLIVLDDVSSIQEWDSIKDYLAKARRVILTTRFEQVASHCSGDDRNMYFLKGLEDGAAFDLFENKVFKDTTSFDFYLHPSMLDQAKLILQKCHANPLAILIIGGYLAKKPKTAMEWRKLNEGLSAELEINPGLSKMMKAVLMWSYDGLPYDLKASFLYLSIFPKDHIIQRKRVVRRWIAEGYSREMQHMTAEQVVGMHFDELLDRSLILPLEPRTPGSIDSCQLYDLSREICVSKAREDNFFFTLEEGCKLGGVQEGIRHLVISSNWKRDKEVMQRMLNLSHVRSLTVFGEWRSFFICDKMRFLRVLDVEHTVGLGDHDLGQIGGLLHLRYLSLRGHETIRELQDSSTNLRQLPTLDIRGTLIWRLPIGVTKLKKLEYLRASGSSFRVPRGISKLKALQTLCDVDVAWENATFQDLRELTQLRKLGVAGVNKENNGKFWPAIAEHNQLRSLSVDYRGGSSSNEVLLDGCLGGDLLPPKYLESLKMRGKLIMVTKWVHWLQNLSKLQLEKTELRQDALQAIGMLPNLAILRLNSQSIWGNVLRFPSPSFPSLLQLELNELLEKLEFEGNAMPRLEVLQATERCNSLVEVSGLEFLLSLKEIRLDHGPVRELVQRELEDALKEYANRVTLNVL